MNELLELGLRRIIGQSNDEGQGGYFGGGRGWVPQMLRQKNIISQFGYGHGRVEHGSRGEPFQVEFQGVVAELMDPRDVEGHHQEYPLGPPPRWTGRGGTDEGGFLSASRSSSYVTCSRCPVETSDQ
ncbi:hypothetical protein GOBAR_AA08661 [Gossypium barbadense]|uniref:Uncharacterized protein n=1 Tax=Gossypium barbadense TaxID=3634 RepID=A0A2P5Y8R9_GOSBA|nr:hypothetical protein GOBAR_AA08661 [Gossypium barbadense]